MYLILWFLCFLWAGLGSEFSVTMVNGARLPNYALSALLVMFGHIPSGRLFQLMITSRKYWLGDGYRMDDGLIWPITINSMVQ